ncbi:MAG TPA: hypothetical protein VHD84_02355 [Candidatus Saccharimonadales bacterium]|nr:hypothetical protein [Candidatus Saccharimonadales bacterium]
MSAAFENLLLNPSTKQQLTSFVSQPSQGLLILGPAGSGKKYTARRLSAELLGSSYEGLASQPHFTVVSKEADKSEISIEAARRLIKLMSLRVPSNGNRINRIALIEEAGLLSTEAQNALLKLLEEPPAGSLIILTAESDGDILPTIASRLQKLNILPADLRPSLEFFGNIYQPSDIESHWRLSQGAVGLLASLLAEDTNHPLKAAVAQAKEFLTLDNGKRLIYLEAIAKDKEQLRLFLEALAKVLAALQEASLKGPRSRSNKMLQARRLVYRALKSADNNVSPCLLVLQLALNMPL